MTAKPIFDRSAWTPSKVSAMDRRAFLETSAASLVATNWLLPSDTAYAATPKKGGRLRMGLRDGATTDSLDPATTDNDFMITLGFAIRNCLTEVDQGNNVVPELAESFEANDDATTWRFRLRRGIEFHNGKTLDSEDVVASMNHHRGEDSNSSAKNLLSGVAAIKQDGREGVIFQLSAGDAEFPFIVSDYRLPILPSKEGRVDWASGVGTGAYVLKNFDPGVRAELPRYPNYWKSERAHFDSGELWAIADANARQSALMTGDLDMIDRPDLKSINLLMRSPNVDIVETTSTWHISIPMNTQQSPFDDNDLRLALKYAIDREKILTSAFRGMGRIGNDYPIGVDQDYLSDGIEQYAFDPDRAKHHLKKSQFVGIRLNLSVSNAVSPNAIDVAMLYSEQARRAGIDINIVREPGDGYWSNVWMQKPWVMSYWGGSRTEYQMLSVAYSMSSGWNEARWSTNRLQRCLNEARVELDPSRRREIFHTVRCMVHDHGGSIIPVFRNNVFAKSDRVQLGSWIASNLPNDGHRGLERWWSDW